MYLSSSSNNHVGHRFYRLPAERAMKTRILIRTAALWLAFILLNFLSCASSPCPQIEVHFSPNGGVQQAVAKRIDEAQESIDVAMYAFTNRELAWALVKAQQKGIDVRVLLDGKFSSSCKYCKKRFLCRRNVEVRLYRSPLKGEGAGGIMHHKFAIVDHRILILGSYNWTASAERRNCENLLIITQFPELIETFQKEFDRLWQKGQVAEHELVPEAVITATDLRDLRKYVGRFVAVEGEVKKVGYSERSNTYFLRFDVVRPCFTAVIFSSAVKRFQAEGKEPRGYEAKRVKISGRLIEHPKYGLEIIVEDPTQVQEITDGAGGPARPEPEK